MPEDLDLQQRNVSRSGHLQMVKVRYNTTEFIIKVSVYPIDKGMPLECLRGMGEELDEKGTRGKREKEGTFNWMKWNEHQHFR
jgi:hypothetical protein